MQRIDVVRALAPLVTTEDLFVCGLGALWDDWWNHRPGGPGADNTFSPVILGSISSTALGLAIALPHRRIVALDTDGSLLMNAGILCTLGNERPRNMTIVVFDNGIYECIGGPPTLTAGNTDLARMAEGAGCLNCSTVWDVPAFENQARQALTDDEFGLIVAKIVPGVHPWPGEQRRPTDGVEDKYRFLRHVEQLEGVVIHPGAPQN
jgi:thiamine pyrophosphate-dependent acetolactate synthase large subunit-like protein